MVRRYLSPEQRAEVAGLYREGRRFEELRREYGIGGSTLHRLLREFGLNSSLQLTDKKDIRRSLNKSQELSAIALYVQGLSAVEVASQMSVSDSTIRETVRRYGYTLRKRGSGKITEEHKEKLRRLGKQRWANDAIRAKYLPILLETRFKPQPMEHNKPLNTKRYKEFRQEILHRDKCCLRCSSTSKLDVHHVFHRNERPDLIFTPEAVETLCRSCHMKEEAKRKRDRE